MRTVLPLDAYNQVSGALPFQTRFSFPSAFRGVRSIRLVGYVLTGVAGSGGTPNQPYCVVKVSSPPLVGETAQVSLNGGVPQDGFVILLTTNGVVSQVTGLDGEHAVWILPPRDGQAYTMHGLTLSIEDPPAPVASGASASRSAGAVVSATLLVAIESD